VPYLAYGSNLSTARLTRRVPARCLGVTQLPGWRLAFNKPGGRGSGKANLVSDPSATAWGVVFAIPGAALLQLDAIEGGYVRRAVEVTLRDGRALSAWCYFWCHPTPDLAPHAWYLDHIVRGAEEHGLPASYVDGLKRVEVTSGVPPT
jgi:hypothetical protein